MACLAGSATAARADRTCATFYMWRRGAAI
jgi:hypothetical protein